MIQEDRVPLVDPMPSNHIKFLEDEWNRDGFQGGILGLLSAIFIFHVCVFRRQILSEVPTLSIAEPEEGQYVVAEKLFLDPLAVLI